MKVSLTKVSGSVPVCFRYQRRLSHRALAAVGGSSSNWLPGGVKHTARETLTLSEDSGDTGGFY